MAATIEPREANVPDWGSMIPWRCSNCKYLLGLFTPDKETLQIKFKDFYVSVLGGTAKTKCRHCGSDNVVTNQLTLCVGCGQKKS